MSTGLRHIFTPAEKGWGGSGEPTARQKTTTKNMNETRNYDLTVVMPVYNEEDNMKRVEEKMAAVVAHAPVRT